MAANLKFAIMNTQWKRPLEGLYERDNCLSRGDGQTDVGQAAYCF